MEISRESQLVEEAARWLEANSLSERLEQRRAELRVARLFAEVDRSRSYLRAGCRSFSEWAERSGISGQTARMLAAVGRAVELRPALRKEILTGAVTMDAAAAEGVPADANATGNKREWEKEPPPGGP